MMKTELACNSDSSVDNNNNNNNTVSTRRRVPLSSSLSLPLPVKSDEVANTIIHRQVVKKEEEEGVEKEEAYNNPDDDDDNNNNNNHMNGTTNCDDLNRGQVQPVKKEEDENKETQIPSRSIHDNYDDWRNGNWCWLLSSANANDKSNAMNKKTRHRNSVVSSTTHHSGALENGDTNNTTKIAATTTTGILVTATSTTRHRSNDDDDGKDNNDDEKMKPSPKKKMRHCRQQPINYNDSEEEGEVEDNNYAYEANNPITNDNNDSSSSSSNNNKGNDEEGYESWTKGNWCWLLPFPTAVDEIETTRSSTRRIHMGVNIGGDNPYEDGDSGNEDCDTDADADNDNDNGASSAKSKTRKNKMEYKTWQNKRWDEKFRRLVAYRKENKSTNVPGMYEADPKLARWVKYQRTSATNKNISEERLRRLNSIGFVWKMRNDDVLAPWMEMYHRLVAYKMEHKSTDVPKEYQVDPKLGHWVQTQRKSYDKKQLSTDRINRLESISFVWDSYDVQWMESYSKLVEYKKQNKSTVVPYRRTEHHSLGNWVDTQRVAYNKDKLSGKRLELLNSINFVWSAKKVS